nr:MAG TPA: chromosome segregation ATPase [Caudoviricetes sp.]
MEDYNRVLEATSVAENANGVAAEKMTVYNESLEAAQNRLTASVQQFAQDSNLDRTLALAYDGLSKVVEILNILLNKIPVLSPLIKAMGIALATAFAGNMLKNIWETSNLIGQLPSLATTATSAIGVLNTTLFTIGSVAVPIWGVVAAITAIGAVAKVAWNAWKDAQPEAQVKKANEALQESQQNLDETNNKIAEINKQISEINSKGTLTLADGQQKENLQEQLDVLKEIQKAQNDINEANKAVSKEKTQKEIKSRYGDNKSVEEYQSSFVGIAPRLYDTESASVNQLLANIAQLNKEKQNLDKTDENYATRLQQLNSQMDAQTLALQNQKLTILQDMQTLQNLGDTSSDVYKMLQEQLDAINLALDPSNFETIKVQNLIDTSGISDKLQEAVQDGGEAGQKTAETYANKFAQQILNSDDSIKAAWAQAMNIDVDDLNIDNLTQELLTKFQQMYGQVNQAIFELTSEQVADWTTEATNALVTQDDAMKNYISTVANVTEKQEILNTAYSEMKEKGELSVATVQKLIEQEPSLVSALTVENGHIRINIDSLQDLSNGYFNTAIETKKQQITQTQSVIDETKKRIEAINQEMIALGKLIKKRIEAGEKVSATDLDTYRGQQKTKYYLEQQGKQAQETQDDLQEQLDALTKLQEAGLTYTPSKGKSSGKSAADKAAKEFENEIKGYMKNLKGVITTYSANGFGAWDSQEAIDEASKEYGKYLDKVLESAESRKIAAEQLGINIDGKSAEEQIQMITAAIKKQYGTIDEANQKLAKSALNEMDKASKAREKEYEDAVKNIESLQKMTVNMIETAIDLLQKAGDFVFDLIGKLSEKYDKQIDALDAQMDNLDKIADNLDNQKDAFDDKIDAQKEMLKLQKEEIDNADELAEKNKSIADIDAQLMELQYDDSAEAQAKRLKLLDERAQKEKDLSDYQKGQAYDTKVNALDREKDAYDKNIEAQKKYIEAQKEALKEQQDAIKAAQDKFEQNLSKAQNIFNGFIKVISSDIFKNLAANLLDSLDGQTLYKVLDAWNTWFGDGLKTTMNNTWNKAYGSAKWLGWKKGRSITDILNIGKQGQQNEKDIQTIISNALTKNESGVIDFSGIKNNVDSMNKSFADFSKNALQSITKVDTKTSGVVQNVLNLGKRALNAAANSSNGIISTLAKGIQKITGTSNAGIISVGNSGNGFIAKLSQNGNNSILQMGTTGQGVLGNLGNIAGGILNQLAQGGIQILKGLGGIAEKVVSGIGGIAGKIGSALGIGSAGTAAAGVAGAGGLAGVGGTLASVASTVGTFALPVAAIGTGIIGGIQSFKNIRNVWQDKNASVLKKVATTAWNISPIGIVGNAIGSVIKGVGKFLGFHHSGSDYVKKEHPELDRMLGLKDDETVSVLKVGEAVVPTWANSASSSASNNRFTGSPFGSAVDSAVKSARASMGNSNVSNTTDSSINISMPINIKGDADENTVKALKDATNNIVNTVLRTINTQTRMGGYRNIKAATI